MSTLIVIFGGLMLFAGLVLIINPDIIFKVLRNNFDKLWLHVSAVAVRLLLGALLIYQADVSKFPLTIEVLGWVAIIAAILFTLICRKNFQRLISWAFSLVTPLGRTSGVLALCFGSLLIYAFV